MSTPCWAQLCIDKSGSLSQVLQKAADLQEAISEGATSFLLTEFKYMGVFMVSSSPRQHVVLLSMLSLFCLAQLCQRVLLGWPAHWQGSLSALAAGFILAVAAAFGSAARC